MIPHEQEYRILTRERALAAHRALVVAMSHEAERQGLTEEKLADELEHVKRQIFEETYGQRD